MESQRSGGQKWMLARQGKRLRSYVNVTSAWSQFYCVCLILTSNSVSGSFLSPDSLTSSSSGCGDSSRAVRRTAGTFFCRYFPAARDFCIFKNFWYIRSLDAISPQRIERREFKFFKVEKKICATSNCVQPRAAGGGGQWGLAPWLFSKMAPGASFFV